MAIGALTTGALAVSIIVSKQVLQWQEYSSALEELRRLCAEVDKDGSAFDRDTQDRKRQLGAALKRFEQNGYDLPEDIRSNPRCNL